MGSHRLVIADSNAAFTPNQQAHICIHRVAAVEVSDTIMTWRATRRIMADASAVASWNERQVSVIAHQQTSSHVNGDIPERWQKINLRHLNDSNGAERAAHLQLEALAARNKGYQGEGSVRTLVLGSTFLLHEDPFHDADRQQGGDAAAAFAINGTKYKDTMLHLEMYSSNLPPLSPGSSIKNLKSLPFQRRSNLLDPTATLDKCTRS